MKFRCGFLIIVLLCSGKAAAEGGCPAGYYPYNTAAAQQCVPIPGSGSNSGSQSTVAYKDRWGAISIDSTVSKGGIGTVTGLASKRKAEKAALSQCRASGGGDGCQVLLTYYNQCGVIAWGDNYLKTMGAATVESASKLALEDCSKNTSGCQIYYSGCSYPERVQ